MSPDDLPAFEITPDVAAQFVAGQVVSGRMVPVKASSSWLTAHHYGPAPYQQERFGTYCLFGGPIVGSQDEQGNPVQACTCDRTKPDNPEDVPGNIGDHPQASDQGKRPPQQWTVTDPYARTAHTFEVPDRAMAYAAMCCRSDRPTIVEDPDGVRVIVMREDPRVMLQAVRQLSGGMVDRPPVLDHPESSVQALAGARLFYALYHDAEAVMWLHGRSDRGKVTAFTKAYRAAMTAFLLGSERGDDADPVECGPDCPKCRALLDEAKGLRQVADEAAGALVAQGRREAAEAIRSQARMFEASEGHADPSMDLAARLAEGSSGVQGKDPS